MHRRQFLKGAFHFSAIVAGGDLLVACDRVSADYGPLNAADANGLMLPNGFSSRLIATSGSPVGATGYVWHGAPDGGACFATEDGGWIYVSNSEIASGGGGASMVRFDAGGNIVDARRILSGTSRNCAGGLTPWGKWLSCEETASGRVWECDPLGVAPAIVRPALGRFNHEAAAVDPQTGIVYMTEDSADGGFYRFVPDTPGSLVSGRLEVMTETGGVRGWGVVPDPDGTPTPTRQQVANMKRFNGGEGIWYRPNYVAFATKGDNRIWLYWIDNGVLLVLYDLATTDTPVLSGVDNLVVADQPAANHIFVAEDGGNMEIVAVDGANLDGRAYAFCRIIGRSNSEVTGPAFSPDYTRLYFSSQRSPGETFEVTGPFKTQSAAT